MGRVLSADLRPLGLGELLDRAVHIFVRRFAVFILILAIVAIPIAILQYAALPQTNAMLTELTRIFTLPAGRPPDPRAIARALALGRRSGGFTALLVAASALLGLLSSTACMIAVSQAAHGRLPSVRAVYREALRRWLPQLAAVVAFLALALLLGIAFIVAVTFAGVAIGALSAAWHPAAAVLGIPFVIIVGLATLLASALCYLCLQLSFISIALEEPNPFRGLGNGFRRTFSRALFWRSLLVATIVFGVSVIGVLAILAVAAAVAAVTHFFPAYTILTVVGSVALNALVITFLVLYATDVRIRREGYDLMLAADAAAPATA